MLLSLFRDGSAKTDWTSLVLEDLQLQLGMNFSDRCMARLKTKTFSLGWRMVLDFIISQFLIGILVISFWRGIWDYYCHQVELPFGVWEGMCVVKNHL